MDVLKCKKKRSVDYDRGYTDGRKDGIEQATEYMLYAFVQYLGDKRGWTVPSLLTALKWVHKHALMICDGNTTYDEVKAAVKEEYGIAIQDGNVMYCDEWIRKGA